MWASPSPTGHQGDCRAPATISSGTPAIDMNSASASPRRSCASRAFRRLLVVERAALPGRVDLERRLPHHQLPHRETRRRGPGGERAAGREPHEHGAPAGRVEQDGEILELALDGVRRRRGRVGAVPAPRRSWLSTVKSCARASAIGWSWPRSHEAPATSTSGGPDPSWSKAIVVPSAEVTVSMVTTLRRPGRRALLQNRCCGRAGFDRVRGETGTHWRLQPTSK